MSLFGKPASKRKPLSYDDAKLQAQRSDTAKRVDLAAGENVAPEILYYLAEDEVPEVRRCIATNTATPVQADALLARDEDDEVRCELARKISRLLPELNEGARAKVRDATIEILEALAQDQLPRVRQIVAEELKHSADAPREMIQKLASDIEEIVAAPILEYSPLLSDDDLLEVIGRSPLQGRLCAIARRRKLSSSVADAVVETWDETAIGEVLANADAQIREETLDRIIDQAPDVETWHEPLVTRPELSIRAMRRIAGFVASSLLDTLMTRHDLDESLAAELKTSVRRRLEEDDLTEDSDPAGRADALFKAGTLDDETICLEIDAGARSFIEHALVLLSGLPHQTVTRIIASGNGTAVTSLAWKAGLQMRTALKLQTSLARVPHRDLINARGGTDYPLDEADMTWQLEYYAA